MDRFEKSDLIEAKRQIDSTLNKLHGVLATLRSKDDPSKCRSQITLTERRIKAFDIAVRLIESELNKEL